MENQESFGMESRTVKEASVEGVQRRTKPKKHFVFCVKVTWSDGTVNLVYRRYNEFLHLQTILYQAFPETLGRPGTKRKNFTPLPDTFSSRMNVGEAIFRRMEQVNFFLKEILALANKVAQSKYIKSFLTPTPEDLEPKQQAPRKVRFKKKSKTSFSKTMRGRLQKFGKTRIFGNNISSPIVLEHFIVMDDYKKQAKSDISLKKGKMVDVIEKRECGWWLVDADGEVGWAPALFLETADADDSSDVFNNNVQTFPIGKGEVYVTTQRYVAVEEDELTFDIGVNLQILEKNFDGWWKASYLGREGWVPAMYLKKLGHERRNSRTGRRKSRMFSTNELRNPIEEEDEVVQEIPAEEALDDTAKEDKRVSLPRKISQQVLSAMVKKDSKAGIGETSQEAEDEIASGTSRKDSKDESKTIGAMVEMSSVFLQLQKPDKGSGRVSPRPRTPERSKRVSDPVSKSPRPTLQRKAVSDLVASTFDPRSIGINHEDSKDDLGLMNSRSRSLESMRADKESGGYRNAVDSKWKPETKNVLSTSLPSLHETPESEHSEVGDDATIQPDPELPEISNKLSVSSETSCRENKERSVSLESAPDSDTGSCDISYESTTHTELVEALDGFCKQPVDTSKNFKRFSLEEEMPIILPPKRSPPVPPNAPQSAIVDPPRPKSPSRSPPVPSDIPQSSMVDSPRAKSPKRSPPVPSDVPQSSMVDSPRAKSPSRSSTVPNGSMTFPRSKMQQSSDEEQQKIRTIPKTSSDRKIIRQGSLEKETAYELNEDVMVWSPSDESDPELSLSFKRVLYPRTGTSPAIVVDETEEHSIEEGEFRLALDDGVASTESFEIEVNLQNSVDPSDEEGYFTDIYYVKEPHEVDSEMYLAKDSQVQVLEKASTGWWLVQSEEGVRGWTCSSHLCPASQVNGKHEYSEPEEDEDDKEPEEPEDLEERSQQMSCRVIEDYSGDPDNKEMELQENEMIRVLHASESGWWFVQNEEGEVGWAPSNYLEVFEDEDVEFSR